MTQIIDIEISEPTNSVRLAIEGEKSNNNDETSEKEKSGFTLKNVCNIALSLFYRLVYLVEAILAMYFLIKIKGSLLFLLLILPMLLILVDGFYVAAFRRGIEHPW